MKHRHMHATITQTHACGTAVVQTWHLLPLLCSVFSTVSFFVFCLGQSVQQAEGEGEKGRRGQMRERRKSKKQSQKREKVGKRLASATQMIFAPSISEL